jgi:cytochrome b561
MPVSGSLMSLLGGHDINFFNLFTIKSFMQNKEIAKIFWNIHVYSAFALTATLILHILAALYHHFIRKDNVLMRMIRGY